jgi:hypothetical protein
MKKTLMILTLGLFLGTIGYTSVAVANGVQVEQAGDDDKKKCKKKDCKKEDCCKKDKAENAEAKSCDKKEGEKKACCSHKKAEK